ncbi:hypothetical protein Tco_0536040 [Tanacetum coccineum]
MSNLTACLNDLSYIPLNNEQNEPTQGDIGKTSNDPTQAKHNEFEELYASANEELYSSCDYVTRLDFMAKFTYFKVKDVSGKMSQGFMRRILFWYRLVNCYGVKKCARAGMYSGRLDTTESISLSKSKNIGLYSISASFELLLSQQLEEHFVDSVDRTSNSLVQVNSCRNTVYGTR